MANGKATKIFLPTEASAVLGALGGMAELLKSDGRGRPSRNSGNARKAAPAG